MSAGEEGSAVGRVEIKHGLVVGHCVVAEHTVSDMAYGDFRMAVPCVQHIDILNRRCIGTVARYAEKLYIALFHVFHEHVVSESIVDIVAHIGFEDYFDRYFCTIAGSGRFVTGAGCEHYGSRYE